MSVEIGKSYHLKDDFFALIGDAEEGLMKNKENGHYRPHYFFLKDIQTEGIYWAIPQSSQVEKYQRIMQAKIARDRNHRCDTIVIGDFGGKQNAFLIQNMFPVLEKYVDHEHTIGGIGVHIHQALSEEIKTKASRVLSLHRRGVRLMFPDIDRIYELMKVELAKEQ